MKGKSLLEINKKAGWLLKIKITSAIQISINKGRVIFADYSGRFFY
jgi:hypothetical protein